MKQWIAGNAYQKFNDKGTWFSVWNVREEFATEQLFSIYLDSLK